MRPPQAVFVPATLAFFAALSGCGSTSESSGSPFLGAEGSESKGPNSEGSESGTSGSGRAESGNTESGTSGSGGPDSDSGRSESGASEPAGSNSGESDSGASEPDVLPSKVRLLHLGLNTPSVDVSANDRLLLAEDLEFRGGTGYVDLPPGRSLFGVNTLGTSSGATPFSWGLSLDGDERYTVAIIGDRLAGAPAQSLQPVLVLDDNVDIAVTDIRITVVHAVSAFGPVDLLEVTDSGSPRLLAWDIQFGEAVTLPDMPAVATELGFDIDNDGVPDAVWSLPDVDEGGLQVNAFASGDEEGAVALLAQTPDGAIVPLHRTR